MRYVLAVILACAVGVPAAHAFPTFSPNAVSLSKTDPIAQTATKRGHARVSRRGRSRSLGGIHPLVGSGDY
ncbi:hypothetical protein [Rhodoblastus sp.]|jgi:hypothetical protein|uniref:hypothetical protein n=1 Tax=Rhodoblastus sp. TaxID=1962975 RepID=UPI0025E403AE|nr:hypothetical protein [Rhodoblastus sp.]